MKYINFKNYISIRISTNEMSNEKSVNNLQNCPICKSIKNIKIYDKVRGSGNITDFEFKNQLINKVDCCFRR